MPRSTKPASPKNDALAAAAISQLEQKMVLLEAKVQKLQSQVATFKKGAITRRDNQTAAQLRAKLGGL